MLLTEIFQIYVPKHQVATHSFDLWGVLVDALQLGTQKIEKYRELAPSLNIPPEIIEKVASNYFLICKGDKEASKQPLKNETIDALEQVLHHHGIFNTPYETALYPDALDTMRRIISAGEKIIIVTSKPSPGLKEALPQDIAEHLGSIYGEAKSTAHFNTVAELESKRYNRKVISHTEDSQSELRLINGSAIGTKILVERDPARYQQVLEDIAQGKENKLIQELKLDCIHHYVNRLTDVDYSSFVRKR